MDGHRGRNEYYFYPIIRDVVDNSLHVATKGYSHTVYNSMSIGGLAPLDFNFSYDIYSPKTGKRIKIGDYVDLYIVKEVKKLQVVNGNQIQIDDIEYRYFDKIENLKKYKLLGHHMLFNEVSDNFLDEVNDMILYEGLIDFDVYK